MGGPVTVVTAGGDLLAEGGPNAKIRMVTPPLVLGGGSNLDVGLAISSAEPGFSVRVAHRIIPVDLSEPGSWIRSTNAWTTNGEHFETFDVSGQTGLFVQVALFTSLASGNRATLAGRRRLRSWRGSLGALGRSTSPGVATREGPRGTRCTRTG